MENKINLAELKKEIPFKWREQSKNKDKTKSNYVAYINSRQVQNLLDEVVGVENWQDEYYTQKNNLFCRIGIKINGEWVYKSDCGTESSFDKEKGESSDAFKRAAVKWGIGRFLYDKPLVSINLEKNGNYYNPVDNNGKKIWNVEKYINDLQNNQKSVNQDWNNRNKEVKKEVSGPAPEIKKEIPSLDHQKEKALNYWNKYITNTKSSNDIELLFTATITKYPELAKDKDFLLLVDKAKKDILK